VKLCIYHPALPADESAAPSSVAANETHSSSGGGTCGSGASSTLPLTPPVQAMDISLTETEDDVMDVIDAVLTSSAGVYVFFSVYHALVASCGVRQQLAFTQLSPLLSLLFSVANKRKKFC